MREKKNELEELNWGGLKEVRDLQNEVTVWSEKKKKKNVGKNDHLKSSPSFYVKQKMRKSNSRLWHIAFFLIVFLYCVYINYTNCTVPSEGFLYF